MIFSAVTTLCYGAVDCCAFAELRSSSENWDDVYYAYYGKDGVTAENIISSQVLYVDINLEEIKVDIVASEPAELPVSYRERTKIESECEETCLLPEFNASEYTLVIEVDGILHIESLEYVLKKEQIFDVIAPLPVNYVRANITEEGIVLTWINPASRDFKGVKVLRKEGSYPDENFSKAILDSDAYDISYLVKENRLTDKDLEEKQYFYMIYSYDANNNYARGIGVAINYTKPEQLLERIEINKPVRWTKRAEGSFELPSYATNVSIYRADTREKIDALIERKAHVLNISLELGSYEITYETPAPSKIENIISDVKKQITITSDVHYEDILAHTELPTEAKEERVHLYWLINNSRIEVPITKYDLNNNSLIDYIEWTVPSLSNQTYELVIEISGAVHSI
jgi:hypothetical protein